MDIRTDARAPWETRHKGRILTILHQATSTPGRIGRFLELRGYGTDEMQVTVPPAQPGDLGPLGPFAPLLLVELLALLAGKPGKVFLRNEILNQVWGTEVIVGDRTIDVHIRKIRQKLNLDCITTVKGVGYKFEM